MAQRYTVQELRDKGLILLEYISGSQMYGTNNEKSDVDHKGIFILPDEDFSDYNYTPEWEEVESGKFLLPDGKECEMKFYELRKFLMLLEKNNPNTLEIFDIPEGCLIYKHPLMSIILNNEQKILSKKSFLSFSGYAMAQIDKAHGKNKKQHWEKERFERKTILDFCYIADKQGSIPVKQWFQEKMDIVLIPDSLIKDNESIGLKFNSPRFGLSKIPHMTWCYGIYEGEGMRGFTNGDETSESLRLSEVPKDATPIAIMQFNESAWSIHCDEYKSYQVWLSERNESRWVDVKGHGQKIDGKNMLHMQRLINMAEDIANGKGVISRRPEAKELLKIRKGEISLQELLDNAKTNLQTVKDIFDKSNLPEAPDSDFFLTANEIIRKAFNIQK
jgi:uncharacterized protein